MKNKQLIEQGKKGLLALAELQISKLENSNNELIKKYDKNENALPEINENLHKIVGSRYDSIVKMYDEISKNRNSLDKFTERYKKAKEERLTLLMVYQDRKRRLSKIKGWREQK